MSNTILFSKINIIKPLAAMPRINLSNIGKILGMPGVLPEAARFWKWKRSPLCYAIPEKLLFDTGS